MQPLPDHTVRHNLSTDLDPSQPPSLTDSFVSGSTFRRHAAHANETAVKGQKLNESKSEHEKVTKPQPTKANLAHAKPSHVKGACCHNGRNYSEAWWCNA